MHNLTQKQCDIISALAFSNMNISKAARMVGKNRNTFLVHISLIKQKTNLDPTNFFDLYELYQLSGGGNDAKEKTAV